MGIKFGNYPIKGIDVSQHQGNIRWGEAMNMHPDFAVIKVGAGKTIDPQFSANWINAKPHVFRIAYWYMDYYSNHNAGSSAYGMTDEAWGKAQADNCWNKIKGDSDNYVFLDIENATSATAAPITNYATRAQKIARAFLERMDALNGKTNGIYCSLGLLTWFGTWFKNRPLWVAWYNEVMVVNWQWVARSLESVVEAVRAKGWTGKVLMWQYTSDGDIDDNGSGDGVLYGMASNALDLNIWLESREEFLVLKGGAVIPEPPPVTPPAVIIPALAVPASNQNNALWRNEVLGFAAYTIGSDGCAIVDVDAIIAFLTGRAPDPGQFNRDLKNVRGYEGGLIIWDAVTKINPNIVLDPDNFIRDAALVTEARIDAVLASGRPVMVQVDAFPSTASLEPHWVIIVGKNSNGYIIMDPNGGLIIDFKQRYIKLLRMVVYSKVPAVPPVVVTDAEKLEKLWQYHPNLH